MKPINCIELSWIERAKFISEYNVTSDIVIVCKTLDFAVTIGDKDDYGKFTLTESSYEIIADYIAEWLCVTIIEAKLADDVLTFLMKGLREKAFTLEDVDYKMSKVRDYINERI